MYKLFVISPLGKKDEIATLQDPESIISSCKELQRKYPQERYIVTDDHANIVWPIQNKMIKPKPLIRFGSIGK